MQSPGINTRRGVSPSMDRTWR